MLDLRGMMPTSVYLYGKPETQRGVGFVPYVYLLYYVALAINYPLFNTDRVIATAWIVLVVTALHFVVGASQIFMAGSISNAFVRYTYSTYVGTVNGVSDLLILAALICSLRVIANYADADEIDHRTAEAASALALIGNSGCFMGRLLVAASS